nr:MAG TPA: hypothetical protein [Caudoviricetes sp.]
MTYATRHLQEYLLLSQLSLVIIISLGRLLGCLSN